jgi:predicted TIM-barrel fold metal-dependent hydrolase
LNPEGLEQAADAIRRAPVPVVIDHFGHLDARAGPDQPAFRLILDVLGETHVWIKISGANRLTDEGAAFAQVVPLARALIARAPDRVIWGSDWPHTDVFEAGLMPNDGDLLDMMMEFAPDESVRNRILAENPARLFGF